MWSFSAKKNTAAGETILIKIDGMHCSSCALTIDEELEELKGVFSARSSYAKGEVEVQYDPTFVDSTQLVKVIDRLGYTATLALSKQ